MFIALDGEEPLDLDSRRIEVDQDHGLLPVNLFLRVGFAHHDRELAARIAGPRRPPFASVNDIMLAVAPNGRTNVGSVGRCDVGFRHEESRADLAVHQRSEPAVLVRPCPVTMENFHVPGVWSRTVRSEEHTSELQSLMRISYAVFCLKK